MRKIFDFKSFVINEKMTQLNIPFDKSDPLHGKMHHEHVQDALEDMQIMKPEQYKSKAYYDVENVIAGVIPKVVKELSEDFERISDQVTMFIYNNLKDSPEYWKPTFLEENDLDITDDDVYQDAVEVMAIEDLSEEGLEAWNQFFENQTSDDIYSMVVTITDSIKENDGLIAVWRAITFDKGEYDDVYDAMIKGYKKGIGEYWSWEENAAEAHWGSGGKLFVMHGHVRPEDVDWEATVLKTIYNLKEEEEIEIKSDGAIKLVGMSTDKGGTPTSRGKDHYIEFETPYVVKVGTN